MMERKQKNHKRVSKDERGEGEEQRNKRPKNGRRKEDKNKNDIPTAFCHLCQNIVSFDYQLTCYVLFMFCNQNETKRNEKEGRFSTSTVQCIFSSANFRYLLNITEHGI